MHKPTLFAALTLLLAAGTLPGVAQAHDNRERIQYAHHHHPGCGHVQPRYYRAHPRFYGHYRPVPRYYGHPYQHRYYHDRHDHDRRW